MTSRWFNKKLGSITEIPAEIQTKMWNMEKNVQTLFKLETLLANLVQVSLDFHLRFNQIEGVLRDFMDGSPGVFGLRDHLAVTNHKSLTDYFNFIDRENPEDEGSESARVAFQEQETAWEEVEKTLERANEVVCQKSSFEEELKGVI